MLRVAVTTSYAQWGNFHPNDIFEPGAPNMVAGGETSMLWLAKGLAKAGNRVDLMYDTRRPGTYHGVNFLPTSLRVPLLTSTDYDVLISWEDSHSVEIHHRAPLVIYAAQCNTMHLGIRDHGIDGYQCVSEWHTRQMASTDPVVDPAKFFVVPNGVDLERYKQQPMVERVPFRVIYSSSPDRGLHHLLEIWPEIHHRLPAAELHIFYEMQRWFNIVDDVRSRGFGVSTDTTADRVREGLKNTQGLGVVVRGPVGQWQLAREQQAASLLVYPCDPISPTEGFGITILEALAAGTPVVTSNADAFPELWSEDVVQIPLPWEGKQEIWITEICDLLTNKARWQSMSREGKKTAQSYSWRGIGQEYAGMVKRKWEEKMEREGSDGWLSKKAAEVLLRGG